MQIYETVCSAKAIRRQNSVSWTFRKVGIINRMVGQNGMLSDFNVSYPSVSRCLVRLCIGKYDQAE
jgi:hypothetical protein